MINGALSVHLSLSLSLYIKKFRLYYTEIVEFLLPSEQQKKLTKIVHKSLCDFKMIETCFYEDFSFRRFLTTKNPQRSKFSIFILGLTYGLARKYLWLWSGRSPLRPENVGQPAGCTLISVNKWMWNLIWALVQSTKKKWDLYALLFTSFI